MHEDEATGWEVCIKMSILCEENTDLGIIYVILFCWY